LDCRSSLEAILWTDNVILDDNSGFNLYVVSIIYHMITTLDNKIQGRLTDGLVEGVKKRVIEFLDDY